MDWLKALQAPPGYNLQDALWAAATPGFWLIMSVVSGVGALAIFVWLMIEVEKRRRLNENLPKFRWHPAIDALVIGRLGWMGGLILGAGVRWNSGLVILSFGVFVLAGTFMALLSATNWCGRRGSFFFKVGQIIGEVTAFVRRPESTPVRHR